MPDSKAKQEVWRKAAEAKRRAAQEREEKRKKARLENRKKAQAKAAKKAAAAKVAAAKAAAAATKAAAAKAASKVLYNPPRLTSEAPKDLGGRRMRHFPKSYFSSKTPFFFKMPVNAGFGAPILLV